MVPRQHMSAVTRGLSQAFGVTGFDTIHDLTERSDSNRVFRIEARDTAYLLRINTRPGDIPRQFTCMQAAADAGLAPRVWYACAEDRVCITDFVNAVPFEPSDALVRIPAALRRLHALAPFPTANFNTTCTFLLNRGPAVDGLIQKFRAVPLSPDNDREELLACYEQLAEVCSRFEPDLAPSHNDLFKPDNMLFDGQRLWFVDWEAAFQNDRYADLAVVANMLVTDDVEEAAFLRTYFGEQPNESRRSRFYLMRQLAHIFYTLAFLTQPPRTEVVEIADFQQRFWSGRLKLDDSSSKSAYGMFHWGQLKRNMRSERWQEELWTAI